MDSSIIAVGAAAHLLPPDRNTRKSGTAAEELKISKFPQLAPHQNSAPGERQRKPHTHIERERERERTGKRYTRAENPNFQRKYGSHRLHERAILAET